ncbi:MAG: RnfABCDGE type electron transport complex subunit D, partial [Candidatus Omnitrophota bacterium]
MINFKSIKTQLILYLSCFALLLALKDKDGAFLLTTLTAVISAIAAEGIVLYFRKKMIQITESAIITGLIVGYVLSSDEAWWKFVLASFLAIFSKHLICFQRKHIFNPAAFGIFLAIVFLGVSAQWKATYVWSVVVPFGVYFAYRFKKLEIVLGYAIIS